MATILSGPGAWKWTLMRGEIAVYGLDFSTEDVERQYAEAKARLDRVRQEELDLHSEWTQALHDNRRDWDHELDVAGARFGERLAYECCECQEEDPKRK